MDRVKEVKGPGKIYGEAMTREWAGQGGGRLQILAAVFTIERRLSSPFKSCQSKHLMKTRLGSLRPYCSHLCYCSYLKADLTSPCAIIW